MTEKGRFMTEKGRFMTDLIIIDERERYGQIDSWTEYLCCEKLSKVFELTIRSNVVLAEAGEYCDEEGEELELPEQIDGQPVLGSDGECILGQELLNCMKSE